MKWLKEKTVRLLTPYLFWSLLAMIPKYYLENHNLNGIIHELGVFLLIPRLGVWGHFWFLPSIWSMFAVFGLIETVKKKSEKKFLYFVCLGVAIFLYEIPSLTDFLGINDFKQFAIYFVIGMITRCYYRQEYFSSKHAVVLCMSFGGFLLSVLLFWKLYINQGIMLIAALIMIFVCWQFAAFIGQKHYCQWISKHNFTIYIFSWFFQAAVMWFAGAIGLDWSIISILMFGAGIAGPVLFIIIYERTAIFNQAFFNLICGFKY